MATPRFYWYPVATGPLQVLDLGETLSDLQEFPLADIDDEYDGSGGPVRVHHADVFRLRIVLERFGDPGVDARERDLQALQSHLNRGGFVGFSRDHAKTWASSVGSYPSQGDRTLYTASNGFAAWSASGTPAEDDEIVVESEHPDSRRELVLCDALTLSPPINLPIQSPGVVFDYAAPTLVRWRDFYPVLWLPKNSLSKPVVTHDRRRNWTLDLTLEYCPSVVLDLFEGGSSQYSEVSALVGPTLGAGGGISLASTSLSLGGSSLEGLLGRYRERGLELTISGKRS